MAIKYSEISDHLKKSTTSPTLKVAIATEVDLEGETVSIVQVLGDASNVEVRVVSDKSLEAAYDKFKKRYKI